MTERHRSALASAGHAPLSWRAWLIGTGVVALLVGAIGWWRAGPNDKPQVDGAIQVVRVSPSDGPTPISSVQLTKTTPSIAPASQPLIDPAYRPLADAMRRAYPEMTDIGAECTEATCTILAVLPAATEQAAHGRSGGTLSEGIERVLSVQGYEPLQEIQFEEISAEDIRARITLSRRDE